jgi:hypothetical protein
VQAEFDADKAPVDALLYAQLRLADSDVHFYRSLVEFALAVKNVQFEKNSLLDYNSVFLTETPWFRKSTRRATIGERAIDRFNYVFDKRAAPKQPILGPSRAPPLAQPAGEQMPNQPAEPLPAQPSADNASESIVIPSGPAAPSQSAESVVPGIQRLPPPRTGPSIPAPILDPAASPGPTPLPVPK